MSGEDINQAIQALKELSDDNSVPKNVKEKTAHIIKILEGKGEASLKASKALNELEEIADGANLQPYSRTQVWNIISILGKV